MLVIALPKERYPLLIGLAMALAPVELYARAVPIQDLVTRGVATVPEAYIQPAAPISSSSDSSLVEIPVIDLAQPKETIVEQIVQACRDWGFFQVIAHGIDRDIVDGMFHAAADFFDLPMEVRMKYFKPTPIPKTTSYSFRFDDSSVVDWRDFLFQSVCYPPSSDAVRDACPSDPPHYRDASARFSEAMHDLARKLLGYVSLGLGLESIRLERAVGGFHHSMVMNRYLPCPQPELVLALRAHTDPNVISLVVQNGVPGLQVLKNGRWITVHGLPNAVLVNIGDQVEILSNGKYKSVEHRVLANSNTTRYSIASFFKPPPSEALIGPIPELVDGQDGPVFTPVNYHDYLGIFFAKQAASRSVIDAVKK